MDNGMQQDELRELQGFVNELSTMLESLDASEDITAVDEQAGGLINGQTGHHEDGQADPFKDSKTITQAKQRISEVRDDIVDILSEYDDVLLRQNTKLEIEFTVKLGRYENQRLANEMDMRRAKRRFSLVMGDLQAGNTPDLGRIEEQLDAEFHGWYRRLVGSLSHFEQVMDVYNSAQHVSEDDLLGIQDLYRKLVRRLHPYLHPDQSENDLKVYYTMQSALKREDLEMMCAIFVYMDKGDKLKKAAEKDHRSCDDCGKRDTCNKRDKGNEGDDGHEGDDRASLDDLQTELELLEISRDVFLSQLQELKLKFPYCYMEELQDPAWIDKRVKQIEYQTEYYKTVIRLYEERTGALLV